MDTPTDETEPYTSEGGIICMWAPEIRVTPTLEQWMQARLTGRPSSDEARKKREDRLDAQATDH